MRGARPRIRRVERAHDDAISVSVPVLSVAITVTEPSASTACSGAPPRSSRHAWTPSASVSTDDGGQALRNRGHRERQREEQHLVERAQALHGDADDEHARRDRDHPACDATAEGVEAALERRRSDHQAVHVRGELPMWLSPPVAVTVANPAPEPRGCRPAPGRPAPCRSAAIRRSAPTRRLRAPAPRAASRRRARARRLRNAPRRRAPAWRSRGARACRPEKPSSVAP